MISAVDVHEVEANAQTHLYLHEFGYIAFLVLFILFIFMRKYHSHF